MRVSKRTIYSIDTLDFDSLDKAHNWIGDQIGSLMDKKLSDKGHLVGPKSLLVINEIMLENAERLSKLLLAYLSNPDEELE